MKSDRDFLKEIYAKSETIDIESFEDSIKEDTFDVRENTLSQNVQIKIKRIAPMLAVAVLALCIMIPQMDFFVGSNNEDMVAHARFNMKTTAELKDISSVICLVEKVNESIEIVDVFKGEDINESDYLDMLYTSTMLENEKVVVFMTLNDGDFFVEAGFLVCQDGDELYFSDFENKKISIKELNGEKL